MRGTGNALRRAAPAPAGGSAPKRPRTAAVQQPKLTDLLKSASKEQLVSLVLELNGQVPGLEGRVAALLPPPDLTGIKASISDLQHKMDKAFPNARWGSNRDNYAYKREGPALRDLKAGLLEHAKTLSECKRYDSLMAYLLFALGVVDSMPHWEADSHNKPNKQTAKQLEGLLVKALKAAAPAGEERAQLRHKVEDLSLALPAARAALGAAA